MSLISKLVSTATGLAHDAVDALTPTESALRQAKREDAEAIDKLNASLVDLEARKTVAQAKLNEADGTVENWNRLAQDNATASKENPDNADSFVAKARQCLEHAQASKAQADALRKELSTLEESTKGLKDQLLKAKSQIEDNAAGIEILGIKASAAEAKEAVADVVASATSGLARNELTDKIVHQDAVASARINLASESNPTANDFEVPKTSSVDAALADLLKK